MAESKNPSTAAPTTSKPKSKKNADPPNKEEILQRRIVELEQLKLANKEEEADIDREVKKANRDISAAVSNLSTIEKVNALQKKCAELLRSMKMTEKELAKSKKRAEQMQKERDTAKSELSKVNTVKTKLETLSRDTHAENKKLRNDIAELHKDDSEKRVALNSNVGNIGSQLESLLDAKNNAPLNHDTLATDELFALKFASFADQYNMRETHFRSLLRCKDLEIQYNAAQLDQLKRAQEIEYTRSNQLTRQVNTFSQTESELRSQLNIYVEKFKQVEDTLNSSNDLFLTFRKEMEEMSKKTKRLEKDNLALTRKHEATNANIISMVDERNKMQRENEMLRTRNANLEKLCRGMQAQGRGAPHPAAEAQEALDQGGDDDDNDEDNDDDVTESEYEGDESCHEEEGGIQVMAPPPRPPSKILGNGVKSVSDPQTAKAVIKA